MSALICLNRPALRLILCAFTVALAGCGDDAPTGPATPPAAVSAAVAGGALTFRQVSAGTSHTCALHGTGAVSCWGSSYDGQVGTGVTGFSATPLMVKGL